MGEVFLKFRIMPDGTDVDLEALQGDIKGSMPEFATLQSCEAKPFAFGLKALETAIVVEDEDGNNDKITDILENLNGVQGVELMEMGRL
ncbi:MAG: elongation factor 1-beta [Thermoplasmatota archaeon]